MLGRNRLALPAGHRRGGDRKEQRVGVELHEDGAEALLMTAEQLDGTEPSCLSMAR